MRITVNGQAEDFPVPALTVRQLLERKGLAGLSVVERNREIVPKERWGEVRLAEGDEVEIVRFVGGG